MSSETARSRLTHELQAHRSFTPRPTSNRRCIRARSDPKAFACFGVAPWTGRIADSALDPTVLVSSRGSHSGATANRLCGAPLCWRSKCGATPRSFGNSARCQQLAGVSGPLSLPRSAMGRFEMSRPKTEEPAKHKPSHARSPMSLGDFSPPGQSNSRKVRPSDRQESARACH